MCLVAVWSFVYYVSPNWSIRQLLQSQILLGFYTSMLHLACMHSFIHLTTMTARHNFLLGVTLQLVYEVWMEKGN